MSIDIIFDFHKRHYLPADVLQAGKNITSIAKDLVLYGVGFSVSKVNHWSFDGYGNVFLELFCTDVNRTKLIAFLFDSASNSFYEVFDRKSVQIKDENKRSLDWMLNFCKIHYESGALDCFSRIISLTDKQSGEYYVYRHLFVDGRIYIGKGKGSRYNSKNRRQSYYARTLDEVGEPLVEKICSGLSEESAYKIESELIRELRLHYGYSFVINKTEGMEKSKDIGDMPFGTLQVMQRHRKLSLDDPRFAQTVNIFKRFKPEIGSAKQYYKSISIYDAAKILNCPMNEVIRAKESSGVVINGFSILTDIEIDKAIAER